MSSARKRAYKHKAYAEIDSLKQELMLKSHHYDTMLVINQALAKKGDEITAERDALKAALEHIVEVACSGSPELGIALEALKGLK